MGENGLLAPHRVGRNQEKTHDGTIVTDKVNEMWGTDMSQTVTLEEGRAYVCTAPGSLDKRLSYAARLKDWSCQAARASPGLRWPFFSISHSAL